MRIDHRQCFADEDPAMGEEPLAQGFLRQLVCVVLADAADLRMGAEESLKAPLILNQLGEVFLRLALCQSHKRRMREKSRWRFSK